MLRQWHPAAGYQRRCTARRKGPHTWSASFRWWSTFRPTCTIDGSSGQRHRGRRFRADRHGSSSQTSPELSASARHGRPLPQRLPLPSPTPSTSRSTCTPTRKPGARTSAQCQKSRPRRAPPPPHPPSLKYKPTSSTNPPRRSRSPSPPRLSMPRQPSSSPRRRSRSPCRPMTPATFPSTSATANLSAAANYAAKTPRSGTRITPPTASRTCIASTISSVLTASWSTPPPAHWVSAPSPGTRTFLTSTATPTTSGEPPAATTTRPSALRSR